MIIITDFDDWTEGVIKQYTSISTYILLQPMHDKGLWEIEQKINEKTRKYSGMFSGKNVNTKWLKSPPGVPQAKLHAGHKMYKNVKIFPLAGFVRLFSFLPNEFPY